MVLLCRIAASHDSPAPFSMCRGSRACPRSLMQCSKYTT
nr:MAG TPA: PROTEIN (CMTI-I) MUTANT (M8L) INHIBITOR, SERINE PROTEASE INHIBITOR [Caudoviricetes sp.]